MPRRARRSSTIAGVTRSASTRSNGSSFSQPSSGVTGPSHPPAWDKCICFGSSTYLPTRQVFLSQECTKILCPHIIRIWNIVFGCPHICMLLQLC
jgi:hypothetical protein